ncbi:hypothetical protein GGF32_002356 [Allomyces javanicus]|nr:hypothetical protein GGF32_002356 [Allomyces javanicus]
MDHHQQPGPSPSPMDHTKRFLDMLNRPTASPSPPHSASGSAASQAASTTAVPGAYPAATPPPTLRSPSAPGGPPSGAASAPGMHPLGPLQALLNSAVQGRQASPQPLLHLMNTGGGAASGGQQQLQQQQQQQRAVPPPPVPLHQLFAPPPPGQQQPPPFGHVGVPPAPTAPAQAPQPPAHIMDLQRLLNLSSRQLAPSPATNPAPAPAPLAAAPPHLSRHASDLELPPAVANAPTAATTAMRMTTPPAPAPVPAPAQAPASAFSYVNPFQFFDQVPPPPAQPQLQQQPQHVDEPKKAGKTHSASPARTKSPKRAPPARKGASPARKTGSPASTRAPPVAAVEPAVIESLPAEVAEEAVPLQEPPAAVIEPETEPDVAKSPEVSADDDGYQDENEDEDDEPHVRAMRRLTVESHVSAVASTAQPVELPVAEPEVMGGILALDAPIKSPKQNLPIYRIPLASVPVTALDAVANAYDLVPDVQASRMVSDGTMVALTSGAASDQLQVIDVAARQPLAVFDDWDRPINAMAMNASYLAVDHGDGDLSVFTLQGGLVALVSEAKMRAPTSGSATVAHMLLLGNDQLVLACATPNAGSFVAVIDVPALPARDTIDLGDTARAVRTPGPITHLTAASLSYYFWTVVGGTDLKLWSALTLHRSCTLPVAVQSVHSLAHSAHELLLVVAARDAPDLLLLGMARNAARTCQVLARLALTGTSAARLGRVSVARARNLVMCPLDDGNGTDVLAVTVTTGATGAGKQGTTAAAAPPAVAASAMFSSAYVLRAPDRVALACLAHDLVLLATPSRVVSVADTGAGTWRAMATVAPANAPAVAVQCESPAAKKQRQPSTASARGGGTQPPASPAVIAVPSPAVSRGKPATPTTPTAPVVAAGVSLDQVSRLLDDRLDKLTKQLDRDRAARAAEEVERQEQLLQLVSDTLTTNVTAVLDRLLGQHVQTHVLPAVVEYIDSAVDRAVAQHWPVAAVAQAVEPNVRAAVGQVVKDALVPRYEAMTREMFEQMQAAFERGLEVSMGKVAAAAAEMAAAAVAAAQQQAQAQAQQEQQERQQQEQQQRQLQQQQQQIQHHQHQQQYQQPQPQQHTVHQLARATSQQPLSPRAPAYSSSTATAAGTLHASSSSASLYGGANTGNVAAAAAMPATPTSATAPSLASSTTAAVPPPATSSLSMSVEQQVSWLLQGGQVDEAVATVLSTAQFADLHATILTWLTPDQVFPSHGAPTPLKAGTVLTLLSYLAAALSQNVAWADTVVPWLLAGITTATPGRDPAVAQYVPECVRSIVQHLEVAEAKLARTPAGGAPHVMSIRLMVRALRAGSMMG